MTQPNGQAGPTGPTQPGYPPPAAPYQVPMPAQPPKNPGSGLGVAGLICGILLGPAAFIGLILSIVGLRKSKAAGFSNGVAVAGIIVSALAFVAAVIVIIVVVVGVGGLLETCADLGPGVHYVNGVTVTCG